MKSMKHLGVQTRLTVYAGKAVESGTFGKGVAILIRGVQDTGSLNAAAKQIKMAYSKAWRIVKEAEFSLGFQVIDRDGARGSTLTKEGHKVLEAYEQVEAEASDFASKRFKELLR